MSGEGEVVHAAIPTDRHEVDDGTDLSDHGLCPLWLELPPDDTGTARQ